MIMMRMMNICDDDYDDNNDDAISLHSFFYLPPFFLFGLISYLWVQLPRIAIFENGGNLIA